jgi:hypothetical protein
MLNFRALEKKYGEVVAFSILMDMERHLRLNSSALASIDPEVRFTKAVALMETMPDSDVKIAA